MSFDVAQRSMWANLSGRVNCAFSHHRVDKCFELESALLVFRALSTQNVLCVIHAQNPLLPCLMWKVSFIILAFASDCWKTSSFRCLWWWNMMQHIESVKASHFACYSFSLWSLNLVLRLDTFWILNPVNNRWRSFDIFCWSIVVAYGWGWDWGLEPVRGVSLSLFGFE